MSAYARLARAPGAEQGAARRWSVGAPGGVARDARARVASSPGRRRRSTPTATSSTSCSSTSCETPSTRRSRRAATCASGGRASNGTLSLMVEDEGPGSGQQRRICSSRSSRPSRRGRASGWCSAGRSPRRTAGRSRSKIEATGGDAWLRFGWSWPPVRSDQPGWRTQAEVRPPRHWSFGTAQPMLEYVGVAATETVDRNDSRKRCLPPSCRPAGARRGRTRRA